MRSEGGEGGGTWTTICDTSMAASAGLSHPLELITSTIAWRAAEISTYITYTCQDIFKLTYILLTAGPARADHINLYPTHTSTYIYINIYSIDGWTRASSSPPGNVSWPNPSDTSPHCVTADAAPSPFPPPPAPSLPRSPSLALSRWAGGCGGRLYEADGVVEHRLLVQRQVPRQRDARKVRLPPPPPRHPTHAYTHRRTRQPAAPILTAPTRPRPIPRPPRLSPPGPGRGRTWRTR